MTTAESTTIHYENAPNAPIHRKIISGAFLGQITDGYMLGIVGIAMSYATKVLGLTSFWLGLINAASMLGILFGSLCIGYIADRVGRKQIFTYVMLAMVLLSIAPFFTSDPLTLTLLRFALGLCIGADYTVGIAMLAEWVPEKRRARVLNTLLVTWSVGYVISYITGVLLNTMGVTSWRMILCSAAIPACVAFLIRIGTPESPAWLAKNDRISEALELIRKHIGSGYGLSPQDAQAEEKASGSWLRLFSPELWRNTVVGGVFFAGQVLPFYAVSLFLPQVMTSLHIDSPYFSGVLYNVCTMAGVLFGTYWLADRIGRRTYLISTFYVITGILVAMFLWRSMPGYVGLLFILALSLALAVSIVIEFSYPAELFPTEVRGSGVGLSVAISRLGAASGTFLLPIVVEHFGVYAALAGCAGVTLFSGIICQMWAPETAKPKRRGATPEPQPQTV
ncbi:MAG: MFS transporter [Desulfovibrio sp.]|jgi:putative MFS transporter